MHPVHQNRDIALAQLRRAIQLFKDRDFICSLTLARAANHFLCEMAAKRSNQSGTNPIATPLDFTSLVERGDLEAAADEMIDLALRNWNLAFGSFPEDSEYFPTFGMSTNKL